MVNTKRGLSKAFGERLAKCSVESFTAKLASLVPEAIRGAVAPLLETIDDRNERIRYYDQMEEHIARQKYAKYRLLQQVDGVGIHTALAYMLTLGDPERFPQSRMVGCFLGMRRRFGLRICARERQEARGDRGGAETGGAAAPVVDRGGGVRAAAEQPGGSGGLAAPEDIHAAWMGCVCGKSQGGRRRALTAIDAKHNVAMGRTAFCVPIHQDRRGDSSAPPKRGTPSSSGPLGPAECG